MSEYRRIIVSAGRSCFVRCKGCYNHFGNSAQLVATNRIVEFLKKAKDYGVDAVTIAGGDPLSRPDITLLLREIKLLGFSIKLDTVGTAFLGNVTTRFYGNTTVTQVSAEVVSQLVDEIGIPIDGASGRVTSLFRVGRERLMQELLQTLELLDSLDARVCINTVAHRMNLDDLPQIATILQRFKSSARWQLFQFTPTGLLAFRNRAAFEITTEEFQAAISRLRAIAAQLPFGFPIEGKTCESRKTSYLLIDSEGLAWIPVHSKGARWDMSVDATSERWVVGDIRDENHHAIILKRLLKTLIDIESPTPPPLPVLK